MDMLQDPQYKTTDGSALRIWRDAAPNKFLSEQHGRQIFDEVIFAEVISPGSKDSSPHFELVRLFAKEANREAPKHGARYADFKEFVERFMRDEDDTSMAGTPLSQWPEISRSLAATLRAQHIFTVDALAALPDSRLVLVGPDGRTWREKAIAYIENAKGNAGVTALAAEVQQLRDDLDVSKEREKTLAARVQELETAAAAPPTPTPVIDPLANVSTTAPKNTKPPAAPPVI